MRECPAGLRAVGIVPLSDVLRQERVWYSELAGGIPVETKVRLITSVGIQSYSDTRYRWQNEVVSSPYVSVALVRLLGLNKGVATVLVTNEAAKRHWLALEHALAQAGWQAEKCQVPEGGTIDDLMIIAERVMDSVKCDEVILLDVTYGLRHLPFVYLAALTYLMGLRGNELLGIYYGAYELKAKDPDGAAPIFDLTPLFRLFESYQAFGAAKETGDLRPVTRVLTRDRGWLFQQGRGRVEFGKAVDSMVRLARALAMGTPLELGVEIRQTVTALEKLRPEHVPWLPARRLLDWLKEELMEGRWGRPLPAPSSGTSRMRKDEIRLDRDELLRQLEVARWYADRHDFSRATLLLREWLVNAAIWAYGNPDRWLDRSERMEGERRLRVLEVQLELQRVTTEQAILGHLWQRVRRLRNVLAHAGMRREEVRLTEPEKLARENLEACQETLKKLARPMPWPFPQSGTLVITPFGLEPGVLFTVCRRLKPDWLLILTYEEAAAMIEEALAMAGMPEARRLVILLSDPWDDEKEFDRILDEKVRPWLATSSPSDAVANITGGTNYMGYLVQRLAHETKRFGLRVRWCFLVDRRPNDIQRMNPYVESEVRWLRGGDESGDELED